MEKPELRGQMLAHEVAVEQGDRAAAHLEQLDHQRVGDRRLAGSREAGEEHREPLLVARAVGLAELGNDIGEGEPLGDIPSVGESIPQLGPGDRNRLLSFGDLVDWEVGVVLGEIHHHPERDHLDPDLLLVGLEQLLGVVGPVVGVAVGIRAGTGMVAADDEMRHAVVLADDGVPHRLAGAAHAHGQRQQRHLGRRFRVVVEDGLVAAHPGVVVDVARLGEADHRVDQQVGLDVLGRPHRDLLMGAVHGIAGLEADDPAPACPGEVIAQLGRACDGGLGSRSARAAAAPRGVLRRSTGWWRA